MGDRAGKEAEGRRRGRLPGRFGAALVLTGLVLFALVPLAEADNRAYASAPVCPAGTRADDCRAVLPATVVDKETDTGGKHLRYYLHLRDTGGRDPAEHTVQLPDAPTVYDRVRRGDRVTVTYWKDQVREVRTASGRQEVRLSPVHDGRLPGAFAVATLALGLGLLWSWWWARYRPATPGSAPPWRPAVGLTASVLVTSVSPPPRGPRRRGDPLSG